MSHLYLLLTPALTFFVVALVGFVGCDLLFNIEEVHYDPPLNPTLLDPVVDNMKVDLTWTPPNPADGVPTSYQVEKGMMPGTRPEKFDVGTNTSYSDTDVVNGMTYYYAIKSFVGTTARGTSNEVSAVPGYTGLRSLVAQVTPGTPRNNFGGNIGMGVEIGSAPIVAGRLGRMKLPGNSQTHTLRLVDAATGQDMPGGAVTINLAGAPDNAFAYGDLPVAQTLQANHIYYVLSSETNMGDQWYDSADTRITTTNAAIRVFAVNEGAPGQFSVAPINDFVYGPLDIQY